MKSRYDYIQEPAERRLVARVQLGAVAVVVAVILMAAAFFPIDTAQPQADVARGMPSAPAQSSLDTRPIGRGEGA